MARATILFFLVFVLSACTSPAEYDYLQDPIRAVADKTVAKVGEPVEVTLTSGFLVRDRATLGPGIQEDLKLSACLWSRQKGAEAPSGGLCVDGEVPFSAPLEAMNGTAPTKDCGTLVIQPGEEKKISHTFSFTSKEPGEIVIQPVTQDLLYEPPVPDRRPGDIILVTFE